MSSGLDAVDRTILMLLQADASLSTADIAARAGASQSSIWRRIEKLEKRRYHQEAGCVARPAQTWAGYDGICACEVAGAWPANAAPIRGCHQKFPEVVECHTLLGETDYLLRVITRDAASYELFFRKHLTQVASVQFTNSSMAISEVKSTTELPLSLLLVIPSPRRLPQ